MADGKQLNIVVIKDGELLPIQDANVCLRMGSIAKSLLERSHKVTWLASTWSHQFKHQIDVSGRYPVKKDYDIVLLECGKYQSNISLARIAHHREFGQQISRWLDNAIDPIDVVICAYPIPEAAAAAATYCELKDIPLILDVRDLWPDVFVDKLGRIGSLLAWPMIASQKRALQLALKTASSVFAVSNNYLSWAKTRWERLSKKRSDTEFRTFPIGAGAIKLADVSAAQSPVAKLKLPKGRLLFTFLGSFGKSYDLELIVGAAQHFHDAADTQVHFVLAGDGEQRAMIDAAASRLPNLHYLGWLQSDATAVLMLDSDVGIMPLQSVAGTFPNKPFQYMAASLPIISSLDGEFADFVDHEGIGVNFPQGDLSAFIAAVAKLTNVKTRSAMAENVRNIFNKKFERSIIYKDIAELTEKIASKSRGG